MNTTTKTVIILLTLSVSFAILGQFLHSYGDMLPPVGKWTNCKDLPEVCDFPQWESQSLSDIVIYRFPNGSMIGQYIGDSPLEK